MAAGARRFLCPAGFQEEMRSEGGATSDPDTEIWLIKAPADFTPDSFSSRRLPLDGYKMQKVKGGGGAPRRFYHVLSSPHADASPRAFLCLPQGSQERLVCAGPLQGVISVAEAHGDPGTLHSIPDRPPLTIPPGLRQRFQPFGAQPPGQSQDTDATRRKKKKKAKKRRYEEEPESQP